MLLLAVDTSTPATSAAVSSVDGLLASVQHIAANRHGELLAPAVVEVLHASGVALQDLDAVACGVGPGPFTGLRVGVATARSLGHALGIPVHGVCSLDALAYAHPRGAVVVATDARRREVYWARYVDGVRVSGPAVATPADVVAELRDQAFGGRLVGAGAELYTSHFSEWPVVGGLPSAAAVGALAVAGQHLDPVPLYLRRPDAVVPGAPKKVLR